MEQQKYDVVVIGSGIGGLCTAALLAKAKYNTLVVEKLPFIGGRCSTMEYKGFKLATGAISIATEGPIAQVYQEVGAKLELRCPDPPVCYRFDGKDYAPPERGTLRGLLAQATQDSAEAERVRTALRRGLHWQSPSARISFHDWLLRYTRNKKILGLFWGLIGGMYVVNSWEFPAAEYFNYQREAGSIRGYGFCPTGSKSLMDALVSVIQANGGEVWTRCRAKKIEVEEDIVKGVVIDKDGKEVAVSSTAVVSDIGPKATVKLAGRDNFDQGYLAEVDESPPPTPVVMISVTSDRPLLEHPQVVVTEARRLMYMACPTLVCPELAPPGKHLLEAGVVLRSPYPPLDLKGDIDLAIQDLKDNIPQFSSRGEILHVRSFHAAWPEMHALPGYDLPQKTPVENLYNVGDGVKPPGWIGTSGCAQAAKTVAEDIRRRFQPEKE